MHLNRSDKVALQSLAETAYKLVSQKTGVIVSEKRLFTLLTTHQRKLYNRFKDLNPNYYGTKLSKSYLSDTPTNLVKIEGQTYKQDDKKIVHLTQYLPQPVFKALRELNQRMQKEIKKAPYVYLGYRSPAFQTVLLILLLVKIYDFDLRRTLKRVLPPAYSQHCSVAHTAIDFFSKDTPGSEDDLYAFAKTDEYSWLRKHAKDFGFYESFPKNNTSGMIWEPWHWQYRGKEND